VSENTGVCPQKAKAALGYLFRYARLNEHGEALKGLTEVKKGLNF